MPEAPYATVAPDIETLFGPPPDTGNLPAERHPVPLKLRSVCLLFAVLIFGYHASNALAEVVEGSVSDDVVYVHWEYDLEQGTGSLLIRNLGLSLQFEDEQLYLTGLLPSGTQYLSYDSEIVSVDPCISAAPGVSYVFAKLPPQEEATIYVHFSTANQELKVSQSEYGRGYVVEASGAGCFVFPAGGLQNFVAVRPIEAAAAADLDQDGDVDLQDFRLFQEQFTGPLPL